MHQHCEQHMAGRSNGDSGTKTISVLSAFEVDMGREGYPVPSVAAAAT